MKRQYVRILHILPLIDGKTYQTRYFNLEANISVGYRVKSREGVRFRQWTTRILKEYLAQGYALDLQRLQDNARELETVLRLSQRALAMPGLPLEAGGGMADIVVRYTQTFLWLQAYDEGRLLETHGEAGGSLPTVAEARADIARLKADLMARGEASNLFGNEPAGGLAAILSNLEQSVFGEAAYPTLESRAAHQRYLSRGAGAFAGAIEAGRKRGTDPACHEHAGGRSSSAGIMKGGEQLPDQMQTAATLWLAADRKHQTENMEPFGWMFVMRTI